MHSAQAKPMWHRGPQACTSTPSDAPNAADRSCHRKKRYTHLDQPERLRSRSSLFRCTVFACSRRCIRFCGCRRTVGFGCFAAGFASRIASSGFLGIVGRVPAGTFEYKRGIAQNSMDRLRAAAVLRWRRIVHFLKNLKNFTTTVALIFVNRHRYLSGRYAPHLVVAQPDTHPLSFLVAGVLANISTGQNHPVSRHSCGKIAIHTLRLCMTRTKMTQDSHPDGVRQAHPHANMPNLDAKVAEKGTFKRQRVALWQ